MESTVFSVKFGEASCALELSMSASPLQGECMQASAMCIRLQVEDGKYRLSRKQALLEMGEGNGLPACWEVGYIARYCLLACCSLK